MSATPETTSAESPAPPAVLTERRDSTLLITIDRPEVRNAVNAAVAEGIAGALDELDADDSLSVGILTGAGGLLLRRHGPRRVRQGRVALVRRPRLRRHRPARLRQAADRRDRGLRGRRRHGDRARLRPDRRRARREDGDPRGQALARRRRRRPAAPAAAHALPRRHGARAHRRPAAGRALSRVRRRQPPRRARLGLDVALELAGAISRNGPLAVAASKRILQEQFDWPTTEMFERQGAISGPVFVSEDAKEGAAAFKEKRDPVWQGR